MKTQIKASLITLLIISAIIGFGYLLILIPKLLVSIFMCLALAVVVVTIYNLVLINLNKKD